MGTSLLSGLALITGRSLVIMAVTWEGTPPRFTALQLLGNILFYFGLVGFVEELHFRGLLYRILEDWLGVR